MIINNNDIHVWFLDLDTNDARIREDYALLSVKERGRADRFVVSQARECYVAATASLRKILSHYTGIDAHLLEFYYGEKAKPFLQQDQLSFNLSHAKDKFALAVTQQQSVGIDIEYHAPQLDLLGLAKRFFSQQEYQQLLSVSEQDKLRYFYRLWTLKEAFVKATGEGLSFGLSRFTVDIHADGMKALRCLDGEANLAEQWSLGCLLSPWSDYSAALAVASAVVPMVSVYRSLNA